MVVCMYVGKTLCAIASDNYSTGDVTLTQNIIQNKPNTIYKIMMISFTRDKQTKIYTKIE